MIQSMTGYGKAVVAYKEKKIHVEIKSLNSKALDLFTRVASPYREKEIEIRQMLAQAVVRGKVDFMIWIERGAAAEIAPINGAAVEHYYKEIKAVAEKTGIPEPADWFQILLKQAVAEAVSQLNDFRNQEGEALKKTFEEKIDNIQHLLESIEPYEQSRVEKIRSRITEGLRQIPEAEYDKNRLEQELIYYIEKLDISEEKQRLKNHLDYFRQTLNEPTSQGKKLGFIAQEMGREINTTGSKSNQAEMQNIVVKMKDELEQIKEQILNVL